jgi:general secretion pathway protein D
VTNLWRQALGMLLILALIAGCAARLHRDGLAAMSRGDYEAGVADLSQAIVRDPNNVRYRMDYATARESAVQTLIAEADSARRANQPDSANALYLRVLTIDPQNSRARRGLDAIEGDKRHGAELDAARQDLERKDYDAAEAKVLGILNEDPGYVPAQTLATVIRDARVPITVTPHLKARGNHKVTLQLRDAPTKMVFEVLQRETGINFILDKDVKSDGKTSIFVQDVPVEDAIELVLDQNALARQILSDNTVLIYPNIAAKQKDYEQQIVRTFYLTNAAPKDVENMLKTVLAAKTLFMDERANAVVIRDTPETVRMAERLVASVDIAEPEVMLEVEVLEISRSAIQDLGIQYPTSATLTPSSVSSAVAATTAAGSGGLVLWDLAHQNSKTIGISSLSVTLNAMKQAGVVNTLASPRIRARNKEKAKVLIGSREPVITNSVTPTAGGTPVVTGSVQYLDVGLTLDVQPTVYLDGDVAIKLNLEVSSILKQVTTPSGTVAYEIGTRNANTLLRLRDGETQVLGGLIQQSDTRTANSIPLLGEIPILSHLFGTHHTDREKDEIVLSVTPHVVRMQPHPSADNIQFWYGTETRHALPAASSAAGGGGSAAPAAAPQPVDPTRLNVQPVTPEIQPPPPAAAPQSGAVPMGQREAPGSAIAPVPRQAEEAARAAGAGAGADAAPALGAPAQGAAAAPAAAATEATTVAAAAAPTNTAAVVAGGAIAATAAVAANAGNAAPGGAAGASVAPPSTAQSGLPVSAPPAAVPSNTPAPAGLPGGSSALSLDGPREAKVGEEFPVTVRLATDQSITRLRAQLRYDSSALQLVSASPGDMVPAAAGNPKIETRGGGAQLDVNTTADEPVQGTGSLMVVNFRAVRPRPASDISAMLNVLGASGAAVGNSTAPPLKMAITVAQ